MDTQSNLGIRLDEGGPDLWLVSGDDIPKVWPSILDLLHQKPDEGALANWDQDDLFEHLMSGLNYGLVVGWHDGEFEAVMIVYFEKSPSNMVLWIESGNGDLKKYLPYLEKVERWAFAMGASAVKIRGRKSLVRVMKSAGYGITEYVISKPIRKMWSN